MDSGALCRVLRPRGGAEVPPPGAFWSLRRLRLSRLPCEAGFNLDAKTWDGSTPAHLAAANGKAGALEALAEAAGARAVLEGPFGGVGRNRKEGFFGSTLSEAGADLETPDRALGRTPTHTAAYSSVVALRFLIKAGPGKRVCSSTSFDGWCVGGGGPLCSGGCRPQRQGQQGKHAGRLSCQKQLPRGSEDDPRGQGGHSKLLNLKANLWFKSLLCNFHFNSLKPYSPRPLNLKPWT